MMRSEKEKMLAGEPYLSLDPVLSAERLRCRNLCQELNASIGSGMNARREVLEKLIRAETDAIIEPPFYCDYGYNIRLGENVYLNFNCTILDVMPVIIGANVLIGPNVQIYTPLHPMNAAERRNGLEYAKSVTIGADVWIGGGAVICPGVVIGARSVIGAGSVVTRSVPPDSFAAGNPARVLKAIPR